MVTFNLMISKQFLVISRFVVIFVDFETFEGFVGFALVEVAAWVGTRRFYAQTRHLILQDVWQTTFFQKFTATFNWFFLKGCTCIILKYIRTLISLLTISFFLNLNEFRIRSKHLIDCNSITCIIVFGSFLPCFFFYHRFLLLFPFLKISLLSLNLNFLFWMLRNRYYLITLTRQSHHRLLKIVLMLFQFPVFLLN